MASRGDIEAGKAHIMLYLKNSALMKGLNSIKESMQGLGSNIMGIGARFVGLGASIAAPLAGAVLHFSAVGSELADMSARTGESVGSLAELKFAAEQTGAGLEDIEKATMKMQKQGITMTFDQMAAKIAAVQDPAERTRMAIEAWGKSGTKLLPMVDSLQALRQEARDLGLVPTEEAVGMADAIGDALDKVKSVISATVFEVGAALAPMLLPALETVKNIAGWFNRWAKANGAIIRTVAMIGVGLTVAGAVIVAIGATIFGIGSAFGLLATTIAGVGTVLGFLLSPVTLVIAALAAGIIIWAKFTESGKAAVQGLMDAFAPFGETIRTTIGGIADALKAGDLQLAGQIAVTGLQLIFMQGVNAIAKLFAGKIGDAIGKIGTQLAGGDFSGAWDTVVSGMAAVWDGFVAGIVDAFTQAAKVVTDVWAGVTKKVTDYIVDMSASSPTLSKLLLGGQDISAIEAERQRLNAKGSQLPTWNGAENTTAGEQIKQNAREGIDASAAKFKTALDRVNEAAAARAQHSADAFDQNVAGGADATDAEVNRLMQELVQLRAEAAKAAAEAAAKPRLPELAKDLPDLTAQKASFGSFSAAGLQGNATGGGADKMAKTLIEMKRDRREQHEKDAAQRRELLRVTKEALALRMRA